MQNRIYTCLFLSLFFCCNSSDRTEAQNDTKDTVTAPSEVRHGTADQDEDKTVHKSAADSRIVGKRIYEDTANVLRSGQFHNGEVLPGATNEKWYGIFHGTDGFYLAECHLETARVKDELVDLEGEQSGWLVSTAKTDEALLFVNGLSFLKEKRLEPIELAKADIFPGDSLRFTYHGASYVLTATGRLNPIEQEREWNPVTDYKLYLIASKDGKTTTQLLLARDSFDGEMIDVVFAADIDDDHIPDLIINTSRHYNVSSPTLYLSRPAKGGSILKAVGTHRTVGC